MFHGYFAWQVREKLSYDQAKSRHLADYTPESNVTAFANIFREVCFGGDNINLPKHLVKDAKKLIKRCHATNPQKRATIADVVKEMETWDLT
ncbi:hypothetical protein M378DRAFT_917192 [Amanita muscaria Koide BX008]|uniref:Uncharacterized protein n=1 Tax=Amanita muscaria (strain Koide BX008) TaxID=946122 RepID=A0A0C2WVT8_AMAMK|nr:hypothetical protein M378DRAFT_917192 [Amanita muscaria Koide BX008]